MQLSKACTAALAAPTIALAQAPITAMPLPPPPVQLPLAPNGTPPADQAQPAPQPLPLTWVPLGSAQVQVLDKVNAQNTLLTIKVGQEAKFGSLSIGVQA